MQSLHKKDDRWTYVTVSDLLINRGRGVTILDTEPEADHLSIYQDDAANDLRGEVSILHGTRTLFSRLMRGQDNPPDYEKRLTVRDLNVARFMILKDVLSCEADGGCKYCRHKRCDKGSDTWENYRKGSCPERVLLPEQGE
jgi:hypothetical protein